MDTIATSASIHPQSSSLRRRLLRAPPAPPPFLSFRRPPPIRLRLRLRPSNSADDATRDSSSVPSDLFLYPPPAARRLFSAVPGSDDSSTPSGGRRRMAKISVVGVGNVGMACAQTCLTEGLADELSLVDVQAEKLRGEMLDLQHAAAFLPRVQIAADTDYSVTAASDICIVTAGARQRDGESRLSLLSRNLTLFRNIIPPLVRHSPDAVLLIVANPVDILSYVAWRISGFPPNRVVGSGTNLDSSRLRFLIAQRFGVNAHNIHGYIIGEHGDSSVPLWSSLTIANVPVLEMGSGGEGGGAAGESPPRYTKERLREEFHRAVVGSAYEVIRLKGYTSWAIGYSVASLVNSIMHDQRRIHPVSVLAKGLYGIEEEVFLSLPAQLGSSGVLGVANVSLDAEELSELRRSAATIAKTQAELDI